jgi:hypothetical protein
MMEKPQIENKWREAVWRLFCKLPQASGLCFTIVNDESTRDMRIISSKKIRWSNIKNMSNWFAARKFTTKCSTPLVKISREIVIFLVKLQNNVA